MGKNAQVYSELKLLFVILFNFGNSDDQLETKEILLDGFMFRISLSFNLEYVR